MVEAQVKIVRTELINNLEDNVEKLYLSVRNNIEGKVVKKITEKEIFEKLFEIRKLTRQL